MVSSVKTAVILCSQSSCFLFRGVSGSFWPHSKDYLMLDLELIIGSNVLHVLLRLFIIFSKENCELSNTKNGVCTGLWRSFFETDGQWRKNVSRV